MIIIITNGCILIQSMVIQSTLTMPEWDGFYRLHAPWLLQLIRFQTGNVHVAEDITQDTFVKVMVTVSQQTSQAIRENPRALLQVVAKRLFIDKIRHDVIEQGYWASLRDLHGGASEYDVEAHVMAIQTLTSLSQALEQCSDRQKQIFWCFYFEGLKQLDIGHRLSLSLATVKRELSQCLFRCYHIYQAS